MTNKLTTRDFTLIGVAAIAVTVCFGLMAGFINDYQHITALAQETAVVTLDNGSATVAPVTTTDALIGQATTTLTAIAGLITTVGTIIAIVIGWIRAKTGDKIISKDAEDRFNTVLSQVRQKDNELRDVYRQFLEQKEKTNAVVDIVKTLNPDLAKKYEEVAPKVTQKLKDVENQTAQWQTQADKFYNTVLSKGEIGK